MGVRRRGSRSFVALLLLCGAASRLAAQGDSTSRRGFWIGLGTGVGTAAGTCGGCVDEAARAGATFYASIGGGVNERLLLTLEPSVWISGRGAVTQSQANEIQRGDFCAVAYVYPRPAYGTFLKGGAGYAGYWSTVGTPVRNAAGVAAVLGAGHDWRLSELVVLRGSVATHVSWLGPVREGYETGGSYQVAAHAMQHFTTIELAVLAQSRR